MYNVCRGIKICSVDEPGDGQPSKSKHRGCGGHQPSIKKDGFKITAKFAQVVGDSIENKRILTAEEVK